MSTSTPHPEPGRPRQPGPIQGQPAEPGQGEGQAPRHGAPTPHLGYPQAYHQSPLPAHLPDESDYLDDPVLEPRKALAPPYMVRPEAPANPLPPGHQPPAGSIYPERKPHRGTARKTEISEDRLEDHDAHLPANRRGGEHWQKSRGRRDVLIFGIVGVIVAAVVVVTFLPDKYLGIKRDPVAPVDAGPNGVKPRLDRTMNSEELLAAQPRPDAGNVKRKTSKSKSKLKDPAEMTDAERDAVVQQALKEAEISRKEVEDEMNRLKEATPGFVPPSASSAPGTKADPASTPDPTSTADPGVVTPAPAPSAPKPARIFPKAMSQQEIDAEVNQQIQENMRKMIQEKKLEPAPPPPPAAVDPTSAPAPAVPPRATPVQRP